MCSGLAVKSFPVFHGGQYISLGFCIGKLGEFVYISDVSGFPEDSWAFLKSIPKIKVLVIDALKEEGIFPHFGVKQALEVVAELKPDRTYFTGMSCEIGDHDTKNEDLKQVISLSLI